MPIISLLSLIHHNDIIIEKALKVKQAIARQKYPAVRWAKICHANTCKLRTIIKRRQMITCSCWRRPRWKLQKLRMRAPISAAADDDVGCIACLWMHFAILLYARRQADIKTEGRFAICSPTYVHDCSLSHLTRVYSHGDLLHVLVKGEVKIPPDHFEPPFLRNL